MLVNDHKGALCFLLNEGTGTGRFLFLSHHVCSPITWTCICIQFFWFLLGSFLSDIFLFYWKFNLIGLINVGYLFPKETSQRMALSGDK